ncbi:MAG: sigma-54-dependent transcriptional regulator [Bacteroidales bacterium]
MSQIRLITAANAEIWLVEIDPDVVADTRRLLRQAFGDVKVFSHWKELESKLPERGCHIIFIEYEWFFQSNYEEGIRCLHQLRQINPGVVVVMAFGYGNFAHILPLLGKEIDNWILKPWDDNKLLATLQTSILVALSKNEYMFLKDNLEPSLSPAFPGPVFRKSEAMQRALDALMEMDNTCLLYGEPGVGKTWLATWLHHTAGRKGYYTIDFAGVKNPEDLLASARLNFLLQKGFIETLVLDNLQAISPSSLSGINAWLETLHGDRPKLSIIGLWSMWSEKNPPDDLLVFENCKIKIPSLRERKEDIPSLAAWIAEEESHKYSLPAKTLPGPVAQALMRLPWLGNVAELRQVLKNAITHSKSETLNISDFTLLVSTRKSPLKRDKSLVIRETERQMVLKALEKHLGNISHAARELGITRQSLYRRMEKYGIESWART